MCDLSSLIRANFTDGDEYPVLYRQSSDIVLPFQMIRFTDRKDASLNDTIVFYEWDRSFVQKLDDDHLEKVIPSLRNAGSVVQPDYSIYADEPLIMQKWAVFQKNRVAVELQNAGIEVIPNLRWGDSRSFEFAFQGIPKHQICAIGTYGQIQDREKRYLFEKGLEQALLAVEPSAVLVYGTIPSSIFDPYAENVRFYQYPCWRQQYASEVE